MKINEEAMSKIDDDVAKILVNIKNALVDIDDGQYNIVTLRDRQPVDLVVNNIDGEAARIVLELYEKLGDMGDVLDVLRQGEFLVTLFETIFMADVAVNQFVEQATGKPVKCPACDAPGNLVVEIDRTIEGEKIFHCAHCDCGGTVEFLKTQSDFVNHFVPGQEKWGVWFKGDENESSGWCNKDDGVAIFESEGDAQSFIDESDWLNNSIARPMRME